MKKLILALLAAATVTTAANAQEGSWLLYGNAGFNTTSVGGTNVQTSFNINPGFGYQFSKNWTVGIQGGYGQDKYVDVPNDSVISGYSAGAFLRYTHYFNKTFSMYAHLNAGYMGQTVDYPAGGSIDLTGFGAQIIPAVAINVYNGFGLNFGFGGLGFTSLDAGAGLTQTNFNFTFGQQFNFGITKNFGGSCCKKGGHHTMGDSMRNEDMKKMKDDSDDDGDDE